MDGPGKKEIPRKKGGKDPRNGRSGAQATFCGPQCQVRKRGTKCLNGGLLLVWGLISLIPDLVSRGGMV